jgi:hypothetical protein
MKGKRGKCYEHRTAIGRLPMEPFSTIPTITFELKVGLLLTLVVFHSSLALSSTASANEEKSNTQFGNTICSIVVFFGCSYFPISQLHCGTHPRGTRLSCYS